MSNTGQIKRYEVYGDSVKDRYLNDDGEYVIYDDHLNIVNDLEMRIDGQLKLIEVAGKRIAELENQVQFEMNEKGLARIKRDEYANRLDKIFKVVSSFNGGLIPIGCDGVIMLEVDEYNALVSAINAKD